MTFTSLLGVALMLLAQAIADAAAQTPLWLTFIASALSSFAATATTLGIGWFLLSRTEAYRRASRWEPMATLLWQERVKAYRELLSTYDNATHAIEKYACHPSSEMQNFAAQETYSFQQVFFQIVPLASNGLFFAMREIGPLLLANVKTSVENIETLRASKHNVDPHLWNMILAMRDDIGAELLDKRMRDWFVKDLAN